MNYTLMDFFEHLLCLNLHFSVTSAKRSIAENEAAGGAPNSQHLVGEAVDIKPYILYFCTIIQYNSLYILRNNVFLYARPDFYI